MVKVHLPQVLVQRVLPHPPGCVVREQGRELVARAHRDLAVDVPAAQLHSSRAAAVRTRRWVVGEVVLVV
ncbi:MAG TPA: hypothetical protein DEQ43_26860 [Nocardioides bacterium]|nr:hypothetical protein [Nocardioides sp.]